MLVVGQVIGKYGKITRFAPVSPPSSPYSPHNARLKFPKISCWNKSLVKRNTQGSHVHQSSLQIHSQSAWKKMVLDMSSLPFWWKFNQSLFDKHILDLWRFVGLLARNNNGMVFSLCWLSAWVEECWFLTDCQFWKDIKWTIVAADYFAKKDTTCFVCFFLHAQWQFRM